MWRMESRKDYGRRLHHMGPREFLVGLGFSLFLSASLILVAGQVFLEDIFMFLRNLTYEQFEGGIEALLKLQMAIGLLLLSAGVAGTILLKRSR